LNSISNARCANCNTRLDGQFCHHCGQREEPRVPTIRSVLGEVMNALFGLESKLWRSLWALIAKPGHLTQEFLSGRRQKYTTPFRLYLLLSIMVFAYMAYNSSDVIQINPGDTDTSTQVQGDVGADSDTDIQADNDDSGIDNFQINASFLSEAMEKNIEDTVKRSVKQMQKDVEAGQVDKVAGHLLEPLPKALLIFLPIIAIFFKLLFLGRGKFYLEHLVYLLHNHAFLFIVILLSLLLQRASELISVLEKPNLFIVLFLWVVYVPYYLYKSLRKVYSVSRLATFIYSSLIFFSYIFLMACMLILSMLFAGYTYS